MLSANFSLVVAEANALASILPCGCGAGDQAIVRHVNFQQIKCLLLGSPGFVKDDFFQFLNLEAVRREERVRLQVARSKAVANLPGSFDFHVEV